MKEDENENENVYNEVSKIIDLKNVKNKNYKGILITKKINNKSHLHDKFIIDAIN